ncbi:MAG: 1-acyl-sn-glycerol-3-phosphate acyltransferase [Pedobacter sp.]|nr:1-acyl-sn-glycerol-3-phosphate acyltransferase [Chitinophagaceae bacterium]
MYKQQDSIFSNIFARIWAFWGLISFMGTFLIILIPSLATKIIPNPKGMYWFIKVSQFWMTCWLYMIGCPMKVVGKQNFKKAETYIITYNHNALLDVPLSAPFVPGANQTIAKDSFAKVPLFGWFYARGSVLVNRKNLASRKKSYDLMKAALRQGFHMCIYPEGSRNKTNNPLSSFHDGAFKLAVDTQNSVMPSIIFGTREAMPIHKPFYLLPKRLEIHFLPPIEAGKDATALKQKVYETMWNYYESRR